MDDTAINRRRQVCKLYALAYWVAMPLLILCAMLDNYVPIITNDYTWTVVRAIGFATAASIMAVVAWPRAKVGSVGANRLWSPYGVERVDAVGRSPAFALGARVVRDLRRALRARRACVVLWATWESRS